MKRGKSAGEKGEKICLEKGKMFLKTGKKIAWKQEKNCLEEGKKLPERGKIVPEKGAKKGFKGIILTLKSF